MSTHARRRTKLRWIVAMGFSAVASAAMAQESDDAEIRSRLETIFSSNDEWSDIDVSVNGGVVALGGTVLRAERADEAVEVARGVDRVVFVIDRIEAARDLTRTLRSAVERLQERLYDLLGWIPLLIVALLSFAAFYLLSGLVAAKVQSSKAISGNRFVRDIAQQVARLAVLLIGLLFALDLLDATGALGAVLGTAGIFGLALGFAFRDLVENYIASILLSLRHPFAPNDHVIVDGHEGRVVRLTSRATILLTLDGNHLRIPNSAVFKASILNYTRNALRRFSFELGIGTEEDVRKALTLGVEALTKVEGVLDEPRATALAHELGDSTVQLRFRGWVNQTHHDLAKVESAAIIAVKDALDDAGIEMPEPIYRVYTVEPPPADAASPRPRPRRETIGIDVSADQHLDRQVLTEREQGEEDLLSAGAPLE